MFYQEPYKNALALQRLIVAAAESGTENKILASLARAFVELEYLKRCIAGKPNPRPIDTTKLPGRLARAKQLPAVDLEELPPATTGSVQPAPDKP